MYFRENKTTQAAAIFVEKSGGKLGCTRLMNMLYLADRQMLLKYGDPITYDCWLSTDLGPALSATYELINPNSDQATSYWRRFFCTTSQIVELKTDPGSRDLSRAEEQVISDVFEEYRRLSDCEFLDKMLKLPELALTERGSQTITIERLLAVNNFASEDIASIIDHIGEQEVPYRVLESVR
jgi:hypothetical protein